MTDDYVPKHLQPEAPPEEPSEEPAAEAPAPGDPETFEDVTKDEVYGVLVAAVKALNNLCDFLSQATHIMSRAENATIRHLAYSIRVGYLRSFDPNPLEISDALLARLMVDTEPALEDPPAEDDQ